MAAATADARPLHDHLGRLPRRRQPRAVPRVPRPGVPRRLRRLARQVQEPVQGPRRQPPRCATGTTRCATASRRPTASSARSSSPTPCRRSSRASCCSPSRRRAEEYEHRLAGVRAHNRWLVDWCGEFPERRAGIGQIFLNDVDDAIEDVTLDQGARPARRHPAAEHRPRRQVGEAALRPELRPAVGGAARTSSVPVNVHGGTGDPDYGPYPVSMLLYINEVALLLAAPVRAAACCRACSSGSRGLKFVMTETGCAWVPPLLERLDGIDAAASATPARPARSATATSTALAEDRHRVLPPELLDGREPARARPTSRPATRSASTGSCGAATTRTTRARTRTPASTCGPGSTTSTRGRAAPDPRRQRRRALRLRPRRPGPAGREGRADGRRGRHADRRGARQDPRPAVRRHGPAGDQVSDAYGHRAAARSTRRRTRSSTTRRPASGASPSTGPRSATRSTTRCGAS